VGSGGGGECSAHTAYLRGILLMQLPAQDMLIVRHAGCDGRTSQVGAPRTTLAHIAAKGHTNFLHNTHDANLTAS
jgi:hypothetical protein